MFSVLLSNQLYRKTQRIFIVASANCMFPECVAVRLLAFMFEFNFGVVGMNLVADPECDLDGDYVLLFGRQHCHMPN